MQCEQFERRLQRRLDQRVDPETDSALAAHALVCQRCWTRLAAQRVLFEGLQSGCSPDNATGETGETDFAARVLAQVNQDRAADRMRRAPARSRLAAALAGCVAASLLLVLAGRTWLWPTAGGATPRQDRMASVAAEQKMQPGSRQPASRPGAIAFARRPAQSPTAANRMGTAPSSTSRHPSQRGTFEPSQPLGNRRETPLPPGASSVWPLVATWPEVSPQGLSAVEQIPGQLKPIATSLNVAINLLLHRMPANKATAGQSKIPVHSSAILSSSPLS